MDELTPANRAKKQTDAVFWAFVATAVLFVMARYYLLQSSGQMLVWFDSATNADIARYSLFSREFWFGISPPVYPYLMKMFMLHPVDYGPMACCQTMLPGMVVEPIKPLPLMPMPLAQFVTDNFDIAGLMIIQWMVSVTCWLVLARAVFRRLEGSTIALTAAALVFLLGCELSVVIWERNVLTESLTISIMVLMIALLVQRWHLGSPRQFVGFLLVLLLFVNLRIVHFYLVALVFALLVLPLYKERHRLRLMVLGVLVAGTFMFNQYVLFESDRSITPIRSVVSTRIMSPGFEDIRGWFEEQGMPEVPEDVVGQYWYGPYADYPELNEWIHTEASGLYQKYLITHPLYFFFKPLKRYNEENESFIDVFTPNLDWQTPENHAGLALFSNDAIVLLLIPIGLLFFLRRGAHGNDPWLLALGSFLVASGLLLGLINWHADLVEVNRHVAPSMLQVRIGLLLMLIAVLARPRPVDDKAPSVS